MTSTATATKARVPLGGTPIHHGIRDAVPFIGTRSRVKPCGLRTLGAVDRPARGLLLDIGGVVLNAGPVLVTQMAEGEPALEAVLAAAGGRLAGPDDELWQQMLRREVTERAYWSRRSAELGRALGQEWTTRDLMNRLYDRPEAEYLVSGTIELMHAVKAAGMPLAALTNDLRDFHGQAWVDRQTWVPLFDTIVDASVTGVMKPDPAAFAMGAEAIGLPAGDVVYLDDMPWNVEGALAAGLDARRIEYDDPGSALAWARERLGLPAGHPAATR